jgi:hypothetical protein
LQSEIQSEVRAPEPVKALAVADRPLALQHLTPNESEFVYNVEVLGLPVVRSASLAGLPLSVAYKPHIQEARRLVAIELRGKSQFTREDVNAGIHAAIQRAEMINEPATEIKGWAEIARINGLDAPQRVDVNVRASVEVLQKAVRTMSDEEIMAALPDARDVVDAEFYVVDK